MLPRFILLGILTSVFQIFSFGLLYDFAVLLHKKIYQYTPHNDLSWGITLHYTFIFYGFLVAALNLLLTFFDIRKITIILLIILLIIFDNWLFLNFQYRPYKVVLIFTLSNSLLVLSFAVDKYLSKKAYF